MFVAGVYAAGKKETHKNMTSENMENVALVQIRHIEKPYKYSRTNNRMPLSKGSLIYEGISLDKDENVYYWQSSPLCIDLFSLPQNDQQYCSLLFKSTDGHVVKFKKKQRPEFDRTVNYGDLKIPKYFVKSSLGGQAMVAKERKTIHGFFTDIIRENGNTIVEEKRVKIVPIYNHIDNPDRQSEIKRRCKELIKLSREIATPYFDRDEVFFDAELDADTIESEYLINKFFEIAKSPDWNTKSYFNSFFSQNANITGDSI